MPPGAMLMVSPFATDNVPLELTLRLPGTRETNPPLATVRLLLNELLKLWSTPPLATVKFPQTPVGSVWL